MIIKSLVLIKCRPQLAVYFFNDGIVFHLLEVIVSILDFGGNHTVAEHLLLQIGMMQKLIRSIKFLMRSPHFLLDVFIKLPYLFDILIRKEFLDVY